MAGFDLLILGGSLVSSRDVTRASIGVRDGRIVAILAPGEAASADTVVDATGLHVLPGLIDTHVHTRHPGVPAREDMDSGTAAAAAGGITTLFEMPISRLPANSGPNVRRRAEVMAGQARIDFALYGGAGHENLQDIAGQANEGVVAFKTFLQPPPLTRLDEFFGLWCTDESLLPEVVRAVAATGRRHCFHCEHTPAFQELQSALVASGRKTGRAHALSRPATVEEKSVAIVLRLAAEHAARVGVVHCSSARSAAMAMEARSRGVDVTVETCPPYLFFTDDALDRIGPFAKCNPPLRSEAERQALCDAVRGGLIDYMGTDHSPFLEEEKVQAAGNIFAAPPGLCGLDIFGPIMLTAAHRGLLTISDVVRLCSSRAAELFGLAAKGAIALGKDADFTIVDLKAAWQYDASRAFTRSRANMRIFDGMPLHGRVVSTWVRGTRVFEHGEVIGLPGFGRFVRPA